MGLLDLNMDDPKSVGLLQLGLGLLAAGGPSTRPISTGQGIASAGMGAMQAYQQAQEAQQAQAMNKMRMGLLQTQMDKEKREGDQQSAMLEAARASMRSPEQMALANGAGPTMANAAAIPHTQGGFDTNGFIGRMMGIDPMKGLALQQSMAKETPYAKIDPKDYTSESIAAYNRTRDPSVLQPRVKLEEVRLGNKVAFRNPYETQLTGAQAIGVSPDAVYSGGVTMRGQNMTDARTREQNDIMRESQQSQIMSDPNRGILIVNKGTGLARPAVGMNGEAIPGDNQVKKANAAANMLPILDEADKLVDKSTGSYIGRGVDIGARAFGKTTPGDEANARLKVLEGNLMLNQPRMEGPQSDKDVLLYRQMAGQIGDPTVPASIKKAALKEIRTLTEKYAGIQPAAAPKLNPSFGSGLPAGWSVQER